MSAQPARPGLNLPAVPEQQRGPTHALARIETRIGQTFGDSATLQALQGTVIGFAERIAHEYSLDYRHPSVQGLAIECARALRNALLCEVAMERAVAKLLDEAALARGDDPSMVYSLAFAEALRTGVLDSLQTKAKEFRAQARRGEDNLWAMRRVAPASGHRVLPDPQATVQRPVPPKVIPNGVGPLRDVTPQSPRGTPSPSPPPNRASSPAPPRPA